MSTIKSHIYKLYILIYQIHTNVSIFCLLFLYRFVLFCFFLIELSKKTHDNTLFDNDAITLTHKLNESNINIFEIAGKPGKSTSVCANIYTEYINCFVFTHQSQSNGQIIREKKDKIHNSIEICTGTGFKLNIY